VLHKNLIAHRPRNRKTTVVFALAIGFIIFVSASYETQVTSLYYRWEKSDASWVRVTNYGGFDPTLVASLESFAADHASLITGYAWRTSTVSPVMQNLGRARSLDMSFRCDSSGC
jgi:hypothetical protein